MPYVEMGQGTYLDPDAIAEELEVNLSQVRPRHAPAEREALCQPAASAFMRPAIQRMRGAWKPLREAGATARIDAGHGGRQALGRRCKLMPPQDGEVIPCDRSPP